MKGAVGTLVLLILAVGCAMQECREHPAQSDISRRAAYGTGEKLDRGVVAMLTEKGEVYVGWRLLKDDPSDIALNVYRAVGDGQPEKLNSLPVTATTDFVDHAPLPDHRVRYWVCPITGGRERESSEKVPVANDQGKPHIAIRLQGDYTFQKVGIADLNGDGRYDFVIKQSNTNIDPYEKYWKPSEDTYKIEAYLHDGTFLWRKDLGWAIEQGIWYSPSVVYDLDGDGKAEVAVKTGEGDPRDSDGRVRSGPEYLSICDGMTGEEKTRVEWLSRSGLGDYNWTSRNLLGIAYLDGSTPFLMVARGTYNLMKLAAYKYRYGRLEQVWYWDSEKDGRRYYGQGAHFMHAADVDSDGKDEVILGSCVIEDNGRALWSTGMGHCDHCYVGDIDPARPGLEIYYGVEKTRLHEGVCLVDARTGRLIWGISERTYHIHSRGLCSDIDSRYPGIECYSGERDKAIRWLHAANGTLIANQSTWDIGVGPAAVYWDADLQREVVVGSRIFDFGTDRTHITGIEGHQAAWADILGDWREEIIASVNGELRIYTTTIPAADRRVCLMQDRLYRTDVVHLAMGYPQPPMTSFYLAGSAVPEKERSGKQGTKLTSLD